MSQVIASNAPNVSSNERINNIHKFLQGANPLGIADDSVKAVLALEAACGELASNEQLKRQRGESIPQLLKPRMMAMKASPEAIQSQNQPSQGFNANAVLVDAFASLRQLLHEGNVVELNNRLLKLNLESQELRQKGETLLNDFAQNTNQIKNLDNQLDNLSQKYDENKATLAQLTHQQSGLNSQHQKVSQLFLSQKEMLTSVENQLAALPKPLITAQDKQQFSELTQQKNQLIADVAAFNQQGQDITSQLEIVDSKVAVLQKESEVLRTQASELNDQKTAALHSVDESQTAFNQFMETAPRPVEVDGEKWDNTLALLTMLTAQLKKAMNEDSIRNMKEQEEVMMKINEASRKDSDKKAKEAAEAERKAADANKAASCASKIFSYVMLAVSVIATVATFGAAAPLTLAVAAIGIALSVADIVLEETGQGSLMQMLAAEISSAVTDMLITFGVPEEEAKKIGSIVGMVLAAVAFLAISLLSMSSFVKNIANTVTNVTKMLAKNVGTLLKSAIKSMPKSFTNALGNMATKGAKAGQSVADNADEMVKLTKFTKLTDKFDDVQNIAKAADKSSDYVSLGGQMVKVGDSAKLAKVADKLDDVKDIAKTAEKVTSTGKTQSVNMARLEVGMKGTGAGLSVANAATSGGLRLEAAAQMRDMKEMLAGMMLNNETIEALTELLNALIKSMSKTYDQFDEMFSGMMTSLNQSSNNKVDMLKTARFA
ncbi:TPA: type III secretion system translocon subunit SctE [Providencia alcalifaciens]